MGITHFKSKVDTPALMVGGVEQTATPAEINKLDGAPLDATITPGAEAGDVIAVTVQMKDANGVNLAVRGNLEWYLSDNADGSNLIATAPSGGVAAGASTVLVEHIADKAGRVTSSAVGVAILNITHVGAKTLYLVLVLPNGLLKVSGAITFV